MRVDRIKANMRCSVKVGDIYATIELGAEATLEEGEAREWANLQHLLWQAQKEQLAEKIVALKHDANAQARAREARAKANGSSPSPSGGAMAVTKPASPRQIDALKKNGVHEIPEGLTSEEASKWLQRIWGKQS